MLSALDWPLDTARLTLRPLRLDDAAGVWKYWQLPEVQDYIGVLVDSFEAYQERVARLVDLDTVVVALLGDTVVGDIQVMVHDGWAQSTLRDQAKEVEAELGYVFDPAVSGSGYATEGVRAVMELCFTVLDKRRVTASMFEANEGSWRLAERLGMRLEGRRKQDGLHHSGRWLDGRDYALLRDEWVHSERNSRPAP